MQDFDCAAEERLAVAALSSRDWRGRRIILEAWH